MTHSTTKGRRLALGHQQHRKRYPQDWILFQRSATSSEMSALVFPGRDCQRKHGIFGRRY